jgi:hypothetical protein
VDRAICKSSLQSKASCCTTWCIRWCLHRKDTNCRRWCMLLTSRAELSVSAVVSNAKYVKLSCTIQCSNYQFLLKTERYTCCIMWCGVMKWHFTFRVSTHIIVRFHLVPRWRFECLVTFSVIRDVVDTRLYRYWYQLYVVSVGNNAVYWCTKRHWFITLGTYIPVTQCVSSDPPLSCVTQHLAHCA